MPFGRLVVSCGRWTRQVCDEYFTKMRRQVYQTPKSYLSFLQLYKAMYKEKINELKVFIARQRTKDLERSSHTWV